MSRPKNFKSLKNLNFRLAWAEQNFNYITLVLVWYIILQTFTPTMEIKMAVPQNTGNRYTPRELLYYSVAYTQRMLHSEVGFFFFYLLSLTTQLPTKTETYSYLWIPRLSLVSFSTAFLKLSHLHFISGLSSFSITNTFLYFLHQGWPCSCMAGL